MKISKRWYLAAAKILGISVPWMVEEDYTTVETVIGALNAVDQKAAKRLWSFLLRDHLNFDQIVRFGMHLIHLSLDNLSGLTGSAAKESVVRPNAVEVAKNDLDRISHARNLLEYWVLDDGGIHRASYKDLGDQQVYASHSLFFLPWELSDNASHNSLQELIRKACHFLGDLGVGSVGWDSFHVTICYGEGGEEPWGFMLHGQNSLLVYPPEKNRFYYVSSPGFEDQAIRDRESINPDLVQALGLNGSMTPEEISTILGRHLTFSRIKP